MYNSSVKPLTPAQGIWQQEYYETTLLTPGLEVYPYSGRVVKAELQGRRAELELEIMSSAFRPATLSIALCTSITAYVTILSPQDDIIAQMDLEAPSSSELHTVFPISVDTTPWSACKRNITLRLSIQLASEGGSIMVLLGKPGEMYHLSLDQPFSRRFFCLSLLANGSLWVLFFSILFLVAAHVPVLRKINITYTIATSALLWLLVVLGLPDLAKIPVRSIFRNIGCYINKGRNWMLPILILLTLVCYIPVYYISKCIVIRNEYISYIKDYFPEGQHEGDVVQLKKAFKLLPWRPEAMLLFEYRVLTKTYDRQPGPFHRAVKAFMYSPEVQVGLEKAKTLSPNFCLCNAKITPLDPVLWYATMLPAAESHFDHVEKEAAHDLLKDRSDPEAGIFRIMLQLELERITRAGLAKATGHANDQDKQAKRAQSLQRSDQAAQELKNVLTQQDEAIYRSHLFQEGADQMAQHALDACDVEMALYWYGLLVEARRNFRSGGAQWSRPPKKMSIFHLYRVFWGETGKVATLANTLLDRCPKFREEFKKQIFDPFKELLLSHKFS